MIHRFIVTIFTFLIFGVNLLIAQSITGKVKGDDGNAIAYATVNLVDSILKDKDYAIADQQGQFSFNAIVKEGDIILVSMVGFQALQYKVAKDSLSLLQNLTLVMKRSDRYRIDEVLVEGKKPMIELKPGKVIYNLDNSALVQTSSMIDILGKAPGVIVNPQDESISLNGKNVLILIDGKKTYLDGSQVYQYLNNIQAGTIEKMEMISNPSAKYDAGAVINIITKKSKTNGWNSSVSNISGIGKEPDLRVNASFNYRDDQVALTTAFGTNFDRSPGRGSESQNSPTYDLYQRFTSMTKSNGFYGRASLDFFLSKKSTLGLVYSRNQYNKNKTSDSQTERRTIGAVLEHFIDANHTKNRSHRNLYSLNFNTVFSEKKKLMINADYSISNSIGDNSFTTELNNSLYKSRLNDLDFQNKLFSYTMDYEDQWFDKFNIELGTKISDFRTDNVNIFNTITQVDSQFPAKQLDNFKYYENIYAGYFNVNTAISKKISVQAGLRTEITETKGNSVSLDSIRSFDYFDLFPSIAINYDLNKSNNFSLSYNKSINRPSFSSLNPFRYYSNIYTASEGNPFLKPAYSHSASLQYTLKSSFMFGLGYEEIKGENQVYYELDDDSQLLVSKYENYGKSSAFVLGAYFPINIFKWWSVTMQAQYMHINVTKRDFKNSGPGIILNGSSVFKLPKNYLLDLSGNYQHTSAYGIYQVDPIYSMNIGVSKPFLKKKLSVKVHAVDLFSLYKFGMETNQNKIYYRMDNRGRGAMYFLALTYKFGKTAVKGSNAKSRAIGVDQKRLNETSADN